MTSDATYPDLASVRGLPEPALRSLLHRGDPIERVWAAWTLGLRLGQAARPDLTAAAHDSPTPGVRSLILVILAGHGERSLVETYARDDPDADVRAAASRSLAGMTAPSDETATNFLLDRLATDESPIVRREILRLALDGRLQPDLALVEKQITDPDRYLRVEAINLMTSRRDLSLTKALQARLVDEPDDELWQQLADTWLLTGAQQEFLAVLGAAEAPSRRQDQGLSKLSGTAALAPWRDLSPFAKREPTVIRWLPRLIEDATEPGALSWLLWLSSRGNDEIPSPATREHARTNHAMYEAISGSAERILTALPRVQGDRLDVEDLRNAIRLRLKMEEWLQLVRAEYLEEDEIDLDPLPAEDLPDDYRSWRDGVAELRRIETEARAAK